VILDKSFERESKIYGPCNLYLSVRFFRYGKQIQYMKYMGDIVFYVCKVLVRECKVRICQRGRATYDSVIEVQALFSPLYERLGNS